MPNTIFGVAVHDLVGPGPGGAFEVRIGRVDLSASDTARRVIDNINDQYGRRASKSHGRFSVDATTYPTGEQIRAYLESDERDFGALSIRLMRTLAAQARRKPGATGGHVFFAHFERDARHYILVALVNDRLGAMITNDSDLADVRHLDMDGFRFAGRVNVSGWSEGDERYIGFLKGKGNVSEYFQEFLGCDTTISARVETTSLVKALKEFAETTGMEPAEKEQFLRAASDICERVSRSGQQISFEAVSNELQPNSPMDLSEYLSDPDRGLNDHFTPDRRALRGLVKFRAKTRFWSMEFDRDALLQSKIIFNSEERTLLITELPEHLLIELRSETESTEPAESEI